MAERRMADIVAEGNCLYQIKVKPKHASYIARNARNKLHMQRAAGNIVVIIKRKNLSFIRIAVIIRKMNYFFDIAHKSGAPNACAIGIFISAQHGGIGTAIGILNAVFPVA